MSFIPLAHRFRRLAGRARRIADAAADIVTLAPAETTLRQAACFLPQQIGRIRGVPGNTTLDYELARIRAGEIAHHPTLAFRLLNAQLLDGTLFAGGAMHQMVGRRPPRISCPSQRRIEDAVALVGTPVSDIYFGHRAVDDNATAMMAREFGQPAGPEGAHRNDWPHVSAYQAALGLGLRTLGNVELAEAWIFQDHGMTAHRRQRLRRMRAILRQDVPEAQGAGHGVVIARGTAGQARALLNEAQMIDTLLARGFVLVDPQRDNLPTIRTALAGASVVVGVEGSALAHGLLLARDDLALVTIQPPHRFNNVWKDFTDLLGMTYGFVVAEGSASAFTVDCDEVLRTLDLVSGPISAPA